MAMSDARFTKLAAEYYTAHQAEKSGKAAKQKIAAKLIPELASRAMKAIDIGGWKVTHVIQHYTVHDAVKARRVLGKDRFIAITDRVINPDKLAQAVSDGLITDREMAKFSERKNKASYINATPSQVQE